jgi:hypothetical protein
VPADFYAKVGNTLPPLEAIPRGGDGKSIPFSTLPVGTTAAVRFAPLTTTGIAFSGSGDIVSATDPIDGSTCVQVSFTVPADATPGLYAFEVDLNYPTVDSETFPNGETPATALITARLS